MSDEEFDARLDAGRRLPDRAGRPDPPPRWRRHRGVVRLRGQRSPPGSARRPSKGLAVILISSDPAAMEAGLKAAGARAPLVYAADPDNWEEMAALAKKHYGASGRRGRTATWRLWPTLADAGRQAGGRGPGARPGHPRLGRLAGRADPHAPGRHQEELPAARLPGDHLPRRGRRQRRGGGHAGHPVHRQVRGLHRARPFRARRALLAPHAAPEHLHRSAEAHPGDARPLRDRRPDARLAAAGHHQLLAHLLLGGRRGGGQRPAGLAARGRLGGDVGADRLGRRQVRRRSASPRPSRPTGVAGQDQPSPASSSPGMVASISGELEEELPGWQVLVGPREAIGIPSYLRHLASRADAQTTPTPRERRRSGRQCAVRLEPSGRDGRRPGGHAAGGGHLPGRAAGAACPAAGRDAAAAAWWRCARARCGAARRCA